MKLLSKKSAPKNSSFMAINKQELKQIKGGQKIANVKSPNEID